MRPRHWPISFVVLALLGGLCAVAGVAAFAGLLKDIHPIFQDGVAAGLALLVSAIALILSGLFPLVLRRLAERED
jgi:hypothetical protein